MNFEVSSSSNPEQSGQSYDAERQNKNPKLKILDLGISAVYKESSENVIQDKLQNKMEDRKFVPLRMLDSNFSRRILYVEIDELVKKSGISREIIFTGIFNSDISTQMLAEKLESNLSLFLSNKNVSLEISADFILQGSNLMIVTSAISNFQDLGELQTPMAYEVPLFVNDSTAHSRDLIQSLYEYAKEYRDCLNQKNNRNVEDIAPPVYIPLAFVDEKGNKNEVYVRISDFEENTSVNREAILRALRRSFNVAESTEKTYNSSLALRAKSFTEDISGWFSSFIEQENAQSASEDRIRNRFTRELTSAVKELLMEKTAEEIRRDTLSQRLAAPIDSSTRRDADQLLKNLPEVTVGSLRSLRHTNLEVFSTLQIGRMSGSSTIKEDSQREENKNAWVKADEFLCQLVQQKAPLTEASISQLHRILLGGEVGGNVRSGAKEESITLGRLRSITKIHAGTDNGLSFLASRHVEQAIRSFVGWLQERIVACERNEDNPICVAAQSYQRMVSIHPFSDANGRLSRLVMDYILLRFNLLPCALGVDIRDATFGLQYSVAGTQFTTALNDRIANAKTPSHVVESVMNGLKNSYQILGLIR